MPNIGGFLFHGHCMHKAHSDVNTLICLSAMPVSSNESGVVPPKERSAEPSIFRKRKHGLYFVRFASRTCDVYMLVAYARGILNHVIKLRFCWYLFLFHNLLQKGEPRARPASGKTNGRDNPKNQSVAVSLPLIRVKAFHI